MDNIHRILKINDDYLLMGTQLEGATAGLNSHSYRWTLVSVEDNIIRKGSWLSLADDQDENTSIQYILEEIEKSTLYRTLDFQVQAQLLVDIESAIRKANNRPGFIDSSKGTFSCTLKLTDNLVILLDKPTPDIDRFAAEILHHEEIANDPDIKLITDIEIARQCLHYLLNDYGINEKLIKTIYHDKIEGAVTRFGTQYPIDQEDETKKAMETIDTYYETIWENVILPIEGILACGMSVDPDGCGISVGLIRLKAPMEIDDLTTWLKGKEGTYFYPLSEEDKEKFINMIKMRIDEAYIKDLGIDNLVEKLRHVLTLYTQEVERRREHN